MNAPLRIGKGATPAVVGSGARQTRDSRRRTIWVALVVQTLILATGMTLLFRGVRARVADKFRDQIVDSNRATAEAVSQRMATLIPNKVEYLSKDWEIAQSVIESLHMPAGGFACLIDQSGDLLCHPDMRKDPGLRTVRVGDNMLHADGEGTSTRLRDLTGPGVTTGEVNFLGIDTHYVATTQIATIGARLLVHQPVAGLLSAGEASTTGLLPMAAGAGLLVLLSTGYATTRLMRRHDSDLVAINTGLELEVTRRVDQAVSFRDAMIFGLAKLADYRDSDTGSHLERIAEYSEILAKKLAVSFPEIDDSFVRRLRVASAMHDIGKVGIEDAILLKPGKLSEHERSSMQRHPLIGADTLLAIRERLGSDELVDMSIVVSLQHHERWDGRGYPLGLEREQISLPARIVSLVDVYDALTSERVYKSAMSHAGAVQLITTDRGTAFDPTVVDTFIECAEEFDRVRSLLQRPRATPAMRRTA